MRQIEKQMCQAITERLNGQHPYKDWKSGNTRVEWNGWTEKNGHTVKVILHQTVIALINKHTVTLDSGGWETPTTKSRINAVLDHLGMPEYRIACVKRNWFIGEIGFASGTVLNRPA